MELTREQELLQKIIQRAWEDESFKQDIINYPIETLEGIVGKPINLPEGKTIAVHDQTDASVIYITIPAKPVVEDMELNEAQLEIVAGGGALTEPALTGRSTSEALSVFFEG